MDPELKRQLEEIHALARGNNQMLRAIRQHQWYSFIASVIFWLVIIVTPFYLYQQYAQPFIAKFSGQSGTATTSVFGLPTSADIQKLINSFKAGK